LNGYVVEAKGGYCRSGMSGAARQFMATVRSALTIPIALSSYRFPNFHPELPWSTFLEFCDLHMPQVAWEGAHDAAAQLRESLRQCASLPNARPYLPTGAVYTTSGWSPTSEDISDFLNAAKTLGLQAVNFFAWDACRQTLPGLWTTISAFNWSVPAPSSIEAKLLPVPMDGFLPQFLSAINSYQAAQISALYGANAIQVRSDQILSGSEAIQAGYADFFKKLPVGSFFTILQAQVLEDSHHFSWKAGPLCGETTLVLEGGKIILDYTFIIQLENQN